MAIIGGAAATFLPRRACPFLATTRSLARAVDTRRECMLIARINISHPLLIPRPRRRDNVNAISKNCVYSIYGIYSRVSKLTGAERKNQ